MVRLPFVWALGLIYLATCSFLVLPFGSTELTPYLLILFGALIVITPNKRREALYPNRPQLVARSKFGFVRRFILGPIVMLIGLIPLISALGSALPLLSLNSLSGKVILAAISVIDLIVSFE